MGKTKRKWLVLDWNQPGCLRAEDIPFDYTQSIKDAMTPSIFGTYYSHDERDWETSTTSTTLQQKILMQTPDLPPGEYRIGWYYEVQHADVRSRAIVEGSVNNSDIMFYTEHEPKDKDNWYSGAGFFSYTVASTASIDIRIKWASSSNWREAKIRRARLEIWRTA